MRRPSRGHLHVLAGIRDDLWESILSDVDIRPGGPSSPSSRSGLPRCGPHLPSDSLRWRYRRRTRASAAGARRTPAAAGTILLLGVVAVVAGVPGTSFRVPAEGLLYFVPLVLLMSVRRPGPARSSTSRGTGSRLTRGSSRSFFPPIVGITSRPCPHSYGHMEYLVVPFAIFAGVGLFRTLDLTAIRRGVEWRRLPSSDSSSSRMGSRDPASVHPGGAGARGTTPAAIEPGVLGARPGSRLSRLPTTRLDHVFGLRRAQRDLGPDADSLLHDGPIRGAQRDRLPFRPQGWELHLDRPGHGSGSAADAWEDRNPDGPERSSRSSMRRPSSKSSTTDMRGCTGSPGVARPRLAESLVFMADDPIRGPMRVAVLQTTCGFMAIKTSDSAVEACNPRRSSTASHIRCRRLDEGRRIELLDDLRVHRDCGLPRRQPHSRFHVPVDPNVAPSLRPEGESIPLSPAYGSVMEKGSGPVPGRVEPPKRRPWSSRGRRRLSASLVSRPVRRSIAAGVVPSRPARQGGRRRDRENPFATRRSPRTASVAIRRPFRIAVRSECGRADPRKDRERHDEVLHVRYGMRTRGATVIPTMAERRSATSHALTATPSLSKSRNGRPGAATTSTGRAGRVQEALRGDPKLVPGTPRRRPRLQGGELFRAAAYAVPRRGGPGTSAISPRRRVRRKMRAARGQSRSEEGEEGPPGPDVHVARIDSRKVVAFPANYVKVPTRRVAAYATSRLVPASTAMGREPPDHDRARTMRRKNIEERWWVARALPSPGGGHEGGPVDRRRRKEESLRPRGPERGGRRVGGRVGLRIAPIRNARPAKSAHGRRR